MLELIEDYRLQNQIAWDYWQLQSALIKLQVSIDRDDAAIAECDRREAEYERQDQEIRADQINDNLENIERQHQAQAEAIVEQLKRIDRDLKFNAIWNR